MSKMSNLWIGLGIGSVLTAVIFRLAQSPEAAKLKGKVSDAYYKTRGRAEDAVDRAKGEVLRAGAKVADKVADDARKTAQKAYDIKGKMHAMEAAHAKK